MTDELRPQIIHHAVVELVGFEDELGSRIEQAQKLSSGHADVLAVLQRFQPMVQTHRDQLAAYLKDSGGGEPSGETTNRGFSSSEATVLSDALRDLCLSFHRCALGYAMLYEVALRLFDLGLREIATKHLNAHAAASFSTAQLLPVVVAWQLARDGLQCACACPMCSIGACGCMDLGTETLINALRDAGPKKAGLPGFVLPTPRPDSELARSGVQGGERILAVDGQSVRGRQDVQDALRKHTQGDMVQLLIQRGSDSPRQCIVQHAGDYLKT